MHTINIATGCDIEHCKRKPNSNGHEKHVKQTQPLMVKDKHNPYCSFIGILLLSHSGGFQKLSIGHR